MALQRVNRRSVPEDVFDQILADVLSGEMQPGETLPSERRLAEVLGVSRRAVREALKRVSAAGLVEVRQGDATTVRDFRRHAGLDLLPRLLLRAGELDLSVVRSILEARLHNGPKAAELAAMRREPGLTALLDESVRNLGSEHDPVERQHHALTFWDHVVDGADSIVFRLMYNTLRATYEPALPALVAVMAAEVGRPEAYRGLPTRSQRAIPVPRKRRRLTFSNPPPRRCSPRSPVWRNSHDHLDRARGPQGLHAAGCVAGVVETPLPLDDWRHAGGRQCGRSASGG
jgi:GntR family transcriptional regulator, transcriptional repressor for pyruvate dehydrogenase complex